MVGLRYDTRHPEYDFFSKLDDVALQEKSRLDLTGAGTTRAVGQPEQGMATEFMDGDNQDHYININQTI